MLYYIVLTYIVIAILLSLFMSLKYNSTLKKHSMVTQFIVFLLSPIFLFRVLFFRTKN